MATTEKARFTADLNKMVEAKIKVWLIVASVANEPDKYETPSWNYEIRNVVEVCKAFSISPKFFRKVFKKRYKKVWKYAFVEFSAREIEQARKALTDAGRSISTAKNDAESGVYSLVVNALVWTSTNLGFYGLE